MPMLNPEFLEKLRVSKGEEGANSGLLKLPCPASRPRSIPIRGWKDDRPELGVRLIELEGHGKQFG